MYRNFLFYVDDTVLDFKAGELKSLAKMFAKLKLTYTPRIEASYLK
ncbi:noncanonical pyrimidine nucleotidase, YjjG family, partial [Lactobacillus rhamnosus]|nr:noncanonical pyrimidine nucleotidase, YjjG family [Lacticaseibacillus rhamnosus]